MNEQEPLFRVEAVEYRAKLRGPGEPLRLTSGWLGWGYAVLLALVALGVVAAYLVRVDGERLLSIFLHG